MLMLELEEVMDRRCNVLTCASVIYTLFFCVKFEPLSTTSGFTIEILLLQCLFVLLFTYNGNGLKDQSNYRPHVDPNLMSVFLVPICLINEMLSMKDKPDSVARYQDVQLSLGVTAVIITKYFFLLRKPRKIALVMLVSTLAYLFMFGYFSVIFLTILSFLLLWNGLDRIPRIVPNSFSFGEMSICLQLCLSFIGRILRELMKMKDVQEDELRLKWIGGTAVTAIFMATALLWMLKTFYGAKSLLLFLCVYTVFTVASLAFLTVFFRDNIFLWFWQLISGDCTVKMLLFSWVLFCGITVVFTISHALQSSILKQKTALEYMLDKSWEQDKNENKFDSCRQRKSNLTHNDDTDQPKYLVIKKHQSMASDCRVSFDTRKVFHLFILLVYIPGLLIVPHILLLASYLVFGVFVIVEAARVFQVPGLGLHLDNILRTFVDERDQGVLFLTHFYLLLGLSVPLWITHSSLQGLASPIKLYSGVLSLGIGDTVACVAGQTFGRHRWKGTNKTVEGTFSSVVAQLGFITTLSYLGFLPNYSQLGVLLGVFHGALYEAFTDQIDNLVLPLALYPFICAS